MADADHHAKPRATGRRRRQVRRRRRRRRPRRASPPPSRPPATAPASRLSSAIPISAASPPAAWCWSSTTCTTAPRSPCSGICMEMIERMQRLGPVRGAAGRATCEPGGASRRRCGASGRAGACSISTPSRCRTRSASPPPSIPTPSSAPPTRSSARPASSCRLHSWFSSAIVEDGTHQGRRLRDQGRPAGDPAATSSSTPPATSTSPPRAGANFQESSFILTTVSRWGGVDTDRAEAFQFEKPEEFAAARPRGQAHHRRLLELLVAEDAAAGHRLAATARTCRSWTA